MARALNSDLDVLMDVVEAQDWTPFITTANLIVSEELSGLGHSSDRLTQIEIYLAAHFATLSKNGGGIVRETIGQSATTYRTPSEKLLGFNATVFGQQALALESTGKLLNIGTGTLKAEFYVV